MSARLRGPQRLQKRGSPDSTKHTRTSSSNDGADYSRPTSPPRGSGAGDRSAQDSATVDFAAFAAGGIRGFLDFDPRPTFIVTQDADFDAALEPVFTNVSLHSNVQLMKALSIKTKINSPQLSPKLSTTEFRAWLKDLSQLGDIESSNPAAFSFWGFLWTGFTLHNKWIVISGSNREVKSISGTVPLRNKSSPSLSGQRSDLQNSRNSRLTSEDDFLDQESPLHNNTYSLFMSGVTPDWTLPQPEADLSPHVILTRSVDWGSTPLGDMSTWSPEFRQIVCLLMANPHPAALFVCIVKNSLFPLLSCTCMTKHSSWSNTQLRARPLRQPISHKSES